MIGSSFPIGNKRPTVITILLPVDFISFFGYYYQFFCK